MCEYCNGTKGDSPDKEIIAAEIGFGLFGIGHLYTDVYFSEDNKYYLHSALTTDVYDYGEDKEIHYCPMCGRNLKQGE